MHTQSSRQRSGADSALVGAAIRAIPGLLLLTCWLGAWVMSRQLSDVMLSLVGLDLRASLLVLAGGAAIGLLMYGVTLSGLRARAQTLRQVNRLRSALRPYERSLYDRYGGVARHDTARPRVRASFRTAHDELDACISALLKQSELLAAHLARERTNAGENARLCVDLRQELGKLQSEAAQLQARIVEQTGSLSALRDAYAVLETARAAAVAEAKSATDRQSEFLNAITAEARASADHLRGVSELFAGTRLNTRQRYFLDSIRGSVDGFATAMNDRRELLHLETGRVILECVDFEPLEVAEAVASQLAPLAQARGVTLTSFVAPDVPLLVRGDPLRLRQALIHLTVGVIHAVTQDEVRVTTNLAGENGERISLKFAVMAGALADHSTSGSLSLPLARTEAPTTGSVSDQRGLGLSIAQHVVKLMGGDLTKEAGGAGAGLGFTACFTASTLLNTTVPNGGALAVPRIRIILVRDQPVHDSTLLDYLQAWQIPFQSVPSLDDMLSAMREAAANGAPFAMAIVDSDISPLSIFAVASAVEADPLLSGTKLILLTGPDELVLGHRAQNAGFSAYLTKPVRQSFLQGIIASLFRNSATTADAHTDTATADDSDKLALIADDLPVHQHLIASHLRRLGLSADVAANGYEAVEAFMRHPYALLLLDCQMPVMNGFETARAIREAETHADYHTVIIGLTSNGLEESRAACLSAGMDDTLVKPVSPERLTEILGRWLPHHHSLEPTAGQPQAEP